MGKISKYSNLYRNNTLERRVNSKGILEKYTLKEVQDLVDKLGTEKDENGHIKDQEGFNNASYILMQMYNDSKYSKEKENFIKELNDRLRVDKEEVGRSLEELDKGILQEKTTETNTVSESEGVRLSTENRVDKEQESSDRTTKSYNVNDNKDEYVEYKES
jgi:hypothetical protein